MEQEAWIWVGDKRCYALDKQQAVGRVQIYTYVYMYIYECIKKILELEFQTEDKIKPYADFILITMLPHSAGNQAWQSWISLERQVRNAYDASKRWQANEYEYESQSQSQYIIAE